MYGTSSERVRVIQRCIGGAEIDGPELSDSEISDSDISGSEISDSDISGSVMNGSVRSGSEIDGSEQVVDVASEASHTSLFLLESQVLWARVSRPPEQCGNRE